MRFVVRRKLVTCDCIALQYVLSVNPPRVCANLFKCITLSASTMADWLPELITTSRAFWEGNSWRHDTHRAATFQTNDFVTSRKSEIYAAHTNIVLGPTPHPLDMVHLGITDRHDWA